MLHATFLADIPNGFSYWGTKADDTTGKVDVFRLTTGTTGAALSATYTITDNKLNGEAWFMACIPGQAVFIM